MIKFLIYKYLSHQESVSTYQLTESNEDTNPNQTTSNLNSRVEVVANQENMIFYNNVSDLLRALSSLKYVNASSYFK